MAELTYRGTDIRTATIHFDIVRGFFEPADVRGDDTVVPGKAGRNARARVRDRRIIELRGYVQGSGAAGTAVQQSWHTNTDTLMALCSGTSAAGTLAVVAPYMGLASGTATILARCVRVTGGPVTALRFQTWSIELEAVGDPPEWS